MIGTVSGLRQYATSRGFTAPGLFVDELAGYALQRATDYVEAEYLSRFATGFNEASPGVESAVYEAAMIDVETPGFWQKSWTPGERKVLVEVPGAAKWQIVGSPTDSGPPRSTRIEALLRRYVWGTGPAVYVV